MGIQKFLIMPPCVVLNMSAVSFDCLGGVQEFFSKINVSSFLSPHKATKQRIQDDTFCSPVPMEIDLLGVVVEVEAIQIY